MKECYKRDILCRDGALAINRRLSEALAGWESAGPEELNKISERVSNYYSLLTVRDILPLLNKPPGMKLSDGVQYDLPDELDEILGAKGSGLDVKVIDIIKEISSIISLVISSPDKTLFHRMSKLRRLLFSINLGNPFYEWMETVFKEDRDPKEYARIIYLATKIKNPFIFMNEDTILTSQKTYDELKESEPLLSDDKKDSTINNYSTFLNETRFTVNYPGINAWGYTQSLCKEILSLIDSPEPNKNKELKDIREKFKRDLMLFCQDQFCFPPQAFYIFFKLGKLYPNKESLIDRLKQFYKYNEKGLFEYFNGRLNFIVSGINRIYEKNYHNYKIEKGGIYLSFFSGPPSIAKQEAQLSGCSECITVDAKNELTLRSVHNEGSALIVTNEILPWQKGEQILSRDPESNIKHTHVQTTLPKGFDKVTSYLGGRKKVSLIVDKRGSSLYLKGDKEILEYLEKLMKFSNGHPGVIVDYDTGVPNGLYSNLVLRKREDGGYDILDFFEGLGTSERDRSYISDQVRPLNFSGTSLVKNDSDLSLVKDPILKLKNVIRSKSTLNIYSKEVNRIIEAFYILFFPQTEMPFSTYECKAVISELKELMISDNNSAIEVINMISYLFYRNYRITVSKQGIFYPYYCINENKLRKSENSISSQNTESNDDFNGLQKLFPKDLYQVYFPVEKRGNIFGYVDYTYTPAPPIIQKFTLEIKTGTGYNQIVLSHVKGREFVDYTDIKLIFSIIHKGVLVPVMAIYRLQDGKELVLKEIFYRYPTNNIRFEVRTDEGNLQEAELNAQQMYAKGYDFIAYALNNNRPYNGWRLVPYKGISGSASILADGNLCLDIPTELPTDLIKWIMSHYHNATSVDNYSQKEQDEQERRKTELLKLFMKKIRGFDFDNALNLQHEKLELKWLIDVGRLFFEHEFDNKENTLGENIQRFLLRYNKNVNQGLPDFPVSVKFHDRVAEEYSFRLNGLGSRNPLAARIYDNFFILTTIYYNLFFLAMEEFERGSN